MLPAFCRNRLSRHDTLVFHIFLELSLLILEHETQCFPLQVLVPLDHDLLELLEDILVVEEGVAELITEVRALEELADPCLKGGHLQKLMDRGTLVVFSSTFSTGGVFLVVLPFIAPSNPP